MLDMKILDTFLCRNCTSMNYVPIILKSHNSQTKKSHKCDALSTLFDVPNPPSKITPSQPLKMRKSMAKKWVKANNIEHSDKMSSCENVKKCDTATKKKLKSLSIVHKAMEQSQFKKLTHKVTLNNLTCKLKPH